MMTATRTTKTTGQRRPRTRPGAASSSQAGGWRGATWPVPGGAGGTLAASPSKVASCSDILGAVRDDPATDGGQLPRDRRADLRRRRVTAAGHQGDPALARRALGDPEAR